MFHPHHIGKPIFEQMTWREWVHFELKALEKNMDNMFVRDIFLTMQAIHDEGLGRYDRRGF